MQVREGHIAPDKHLAPDEWADAPEDDAELVDAERCERGRHALRVARRIVPLKGSPRYLALSVEVGACGMRLGCLVLWGLRMEHRSR
jgi:hypothetical protein